MFMQSCIGWVIPMGEQFKFVPFNADTADRATRRNHYLPVSIYCFDEDTGAITTESGESFQINEKHPGDRNYFSDNDYKVLRA